MSSFKHLRLLKQYVEDAKETATPWERYEVLGEFGWEDLMEDDPLFLDSEEYRRKATIREVAVFSFPEPISSYPFIGETIHCISFDGQIFETKFEQTDAHRRLVDLGMVHYSEDNAKIHLKAIVENVNGKTLPEK